MVRWHIYHLKSYQLNHIILVLTCPSKSGHFQWFQVSFKNMKYTKNASNPKETKYKTSLSGLRPFWGWFQMPQVRNGWLQIVSVAMTFATFQLKKGAKVRCIFPRRTSRSSVPLHWIYSGLTRWRSCHRDHVIDIMFYHNCMVNVCIQHISFIPCIIHFCFCHKFCIGQILFIETWKRWYWILIHCCFWEARRRSSHPLVHFWLCYVEIVWPLSFDKRLSR